MWDRMGGMKWEYRVNENVMRRAGEKREVLQAIRKINLTV